VQSITGSLPESRSISTGSVEEVADIAVEKRVAARHLGVGVDHIRKDTRNARVENDHLHHSGFVRLPRCGASAPGPSPEEYHPMDFLVLQGQLPAAGELCRLHSVSYRITPA